ncbi:MAG TPA: hypothetical protein VM031_02680 [Phycisphaerae bacterium]|nr:hypothetical protein [Phycisphaerae bacterium]
MPDLNELIDKLADTPGDEATGAVPDRPSPRFRRAQAGVLLASLAVCLAAAVTAIWQLIAAYSTDQPWDAFEILMAAWVASPYVGLAVIAIYVRRLWRLASSVVVLLGTLVVAGFGIWVVWEAFGPSLDAQSGLVFVFAPFTQWLGCAVTGGLASHVRPLRELYAQSPAESPRGAPAGRDERASR